MRKRTGTWEDNKREGMSELDIRLHFSSIVQDRIEKLHDVEVSIKHHIERLEWQLEDMRFQLSSLESTVLEIEN
jgi:hypothetical protein